MPPVLAALPAALIVAGEVAITATPILGFTGVTAALLAGGIALGLGAVANVLAPSNKSQALAPTLNPIKFAMNSGNARSWLYGRGACGGDVKFWQCIPPDNNNLWFVVQVHDTPADGFESFSIDNTVINFATISGAATNVYTSGGTPYMWRYDKLGDVNQTAESNLVSASGGKWTTNHRLRGCAYYTWHLLYNAQVYPSGIPSPILTMRGRKVWDPRKDVAYGGSGTHDLNDETTWEWTQNSALCLLDYLKGVYLNGKKIGGVGIPISGLNIPSFVAAANVCDQTVSIAAGGTEARYTCNGWCYSQEDKQAVTEALLLSMAGFLAVRAGQIYVYSGAAQTSVMSLSDGDLASVRLMNRSKQTSNLNILPTVTRQDKVNTITCLFSDPSQNYQAVPGPSLSVSQYVTDDGGVELSKSIQHRFTTSVPTLSRLNKLILANYREQLHIDSVWKPKAIEISGGDTFTWSSAAGGYSNQKILAIGRTRMPDGSVHVIGRQETDAKYSWATTEEGDPPSFATGQGALDLASTLSTPQGFSISQPSTNLIATWKQTVYDPDVTFDLDYAPWNGHLDHAIKIQGGIKASLFSFNLTPPATRQYLGDNDNFTNSTYWTANSNVAFTGGQTGPDGSSNAIKLQENSTSVVGFFIGQQATLPTSSIFCFSVWAKAVERDHMQLSADLAGHSFIFANFDLTHGTIQFSNAIEANMEDWGGGWWRCWIVFNTADTSNTPFLEIHTLDASFNGGYAGTIGNGILIFESMLQDGKDATGYIDTPGVGPTDQNTYTFFLRARNKQGQLSAPAYAQIGVTNGVPSSFPFSKTFSADEDNFDLGAAARASGWDGTIPIIADLAIIGAFIGSSSTSTPSFIIPGLPSSSVISLFIDATSAILGKGGIGGSPGSTGGTGGTALQVDYATSINNQGMIAGGGGGGGGSANPTGGGGGGGGGQGKDPSLGGNGFEAFGGVDGDPGDESGPGFGGAGADGTGGTGGSLGNSGAAGAGTGHGAGGGPGNAIVGNSNITWIASGLQLGPVV